MPCGGIYPVNASVYHRCWLCNRSGADHFLEEWDSFLHLRCIRPFLKTAEGLLVIRHRHLIQAGDIILQAEGENMLENPPIG